MIMRCFFSDFLYKGICCEYSFEMFPQIDVIQMSTHNICLYKEVNKKYICCMLKTTKLLDCALIGVCTVIRSNTVVYYFHQSFILHKPVWMSYTLPLQTEQIQISWLLKPHFYIIKLGLQGHALFFLILLKNIDCWYSLEPEEANWSGPALFVIQYVKLYQQSWLSNLIGWQLEWAWRLNLCRITRFNYQNLPLLSWWKCHGPS